MNKLHIPGTLLQYAKATNNKLYVTITHKQQEKNFVYTVQQYKQAIKRYCAYYNTMIVSQSWNDITHNVTLANNMKFNAILY